MFITELTIKPHKWDAGRCEWETTSPLSYEHDGVVYTVPAGYHTDLASIPRIWWSFVPPHDVRLAAPAVLHDFMSSRYPIAGEVFYEAMLIKGIPTLLAKLMRWWVS